MDDINTGINSEKRKVLPGKFVLRWAHFSKKDFPLFFRLLRKSEDDAAKSCPLRLSLIIFRFYLGVSLTVLPTNFSLDIQKFDTHPHGFSY